MRFETWDNFLRRVGEARLEKRPKSFRFPCLDGVEFFTYPQRDRVKLILSVPKHLRVTWEVQAGPYKSLLRQGEFEIKGQMFDNIDLMSRITIFQPELDEGVETYKLVVPKQRGPGEDPMYEQAERLAKILVFCMSTKQQNQLIDRFEALRDPELFYYIAAWVIKGNKLAEIDASLQPYIYKAAMNPDHLGKFMPRNVDIKGAADTPVFIHKRDGDNHTIKTIGGIKKALSRLKLKRHRLGGSIGIQKCFVLTDVPNEIMKYHEAGGIWAPNDLVERLGGARVAGPYLPKGVISPRNETLEKEFPGMMVMAKNAFKGEIQGIAQANGTSVEKAWKSQVVRTFMGVPVKGIEVDMPMTVTNLYAAYGIGLKDDVKYAPERLEIWENNPVLGEFVKLLRTRYRLIGDIQDSNRETEEEDGPAAEELSSVYLYLLDKLNQNPDYDVVGFLLAGLHGGLLHLKMPNVEVKAFEVVNVFASHDFNVARAFLNSVMTANPKRKRNELNAFLTGDLVCDVVPDDLVVNIALKVWSAPGILPSKIDPDVLVPQGNFRRQTKVNPQDLAKELVRRYVIGSKQEKLFNGLIGDQSKIINLKGYEFFIPSGKIMRQFVYPEMDMQNQPTGRVFFSGPALLANELFSFIAGYIKNENNKMSLDLNDLPEDHIKMVYLWYYGRFQRDLFGYYAENIRVPGFGNKAIVPNPINSDTLYCFDGRFTRFNGTTAVMCKMPVLFNQAVHGIKYSNDPSALGLPTDKRGKLSERFQFAISCLAFVPTGVLLAHQNDTDGDLVRVMFLKNHGVPIFTGAELPQYMLPWQQEYEAGERDLKIKKKSYETTTNILELDSALREAWKAKKCIGRASNMMAVISILLLSEYGAGATKLRDALVMMLQRIIRNVKHEDASGLNILDYLWETSFVQIYGALEPKNIGGKTQFMDCRKERIAELISWMKHEVGESADYEKLYALSEIYDLDYVRAMFYKKKSMKIVGQWENEKPRYGLGLDFATLDPTFQFLTMYIRTFSGRVTDHLIPGKPNYYSYLEYPDSEFNKTWDDILANFDLVKQNLIFANGIKPTKGDSLLVQLFRLMLLG